MDSLRTNIELELFRSFGVALVQTLARLTVSSLHTGTLNVGPGLFIQTDFGELTIYVQMDMTSPIRCRLVFVLPRKLEALGDVLLSEDWLFTHVPHVNVSFVQLVQYCAVTRFDTAAAFCTGDCDKALAIRIHNHLIEPLLDFIRHGFGHLHLPALLFQRGAAAQPPCQRCLVSAEELRNLCRRHISAYIFFATLNSSSVNLRNTMGIELDVTTRREEVATALSQNGHIILALLDEADAQTCCFNKTNMHLQWSRTQRAS